ncbi:tandem-95 repeat protein [Vibrio sp. MA40-2]|uniref:tandem-95 repeat protein n=1 Tax=Vibrio sp. MA40-2 TaxID=3391828 RepID=UPI0039A461D1
MSVGSLKFVYLFRKNKLFTNGSFYLKSALFLFSLGGSFSALAADELTFVESFNESSIVSDPAVSPDGRYVYVVSYPSNSIFVHERSILTGKLTLIQEVSDSTNIRTAFGVDVSPDGKQIYVSSATGNSIAVYSRDNTTGHLSFVEVHKTAESEFSSSGFLSVTASQDGLSVYSVGSSIDGLVVFQRDTDTGKLTFLEEHLDNANGNLLDQVYYPSNGPINNVAISEAGNFVFITSTNDDAVSVYARDSNNGSLTLSSTVVDGVDGVDGIEGASSLVLSADNKYLFVSGQSENSVAVFSVDSDTSVLTYIEKKTDEVDGISTLGGARSLAISPDGRYLYVSAFTDNSITVFAIDSSSGSLTYLTSVRDNVDSINGLAGASGMEVDPLSRHLYVAGMNDNAISVFSLPIPAITLSNTVASVTEKGDSIVLDNALELYDSDDTNLESATVSFGAGFNANDQLSITAQAGVVVTHQSAQRKITLTGSATLERYQEILRSLTFRAGNDEAIGDGETATREVNLQISDGTNLSATVTITVVVNGSVSNSAPIISGMPSTVVEEDSAYNFIPTANDVDVGDSLTFSITNKPDWANFNTNTGALTGTPKNDDVGITSNIVISVSDATDSTSLTAFSINVINTNDAPSITINSTLTTDEDNQQTLSFAFNDVDGDTVTAIEKTGPAHGSITIEGTNIVYTPTADYNGNDSFVVTLTDNNGFSVDKTVNVTVSSVNDAPSITINSTLTTDEDNQQTLSFAFNDVDGDTVTATEKTGPAHGSITIEGTNIVYTPTADYNGNDSFVVTLTDNNGFSVDKTVNVTVSSVNDAPSITINSTLTTDEDNQQTLSFAFNDVDGDTVTATEKTGPAHGSITIEGTNIVYTPTADYNGNDSFVVTLTDNNGFSVDKTVNVTVSSVNDAPSITINSTITTDEDNQQTLSFAFNDVDGDTVTAIEKTGPAHGSITIEGTNIVYTPTADYNGNDSFVVTLTDNNGFSVDKTVNVTVSSVNDAPSITINSTLTTDEDNQQTLSFAFNDVDGDTVTAIEKTGPAHGSITIEGTNIVYTPTADYNGNDSFVVTLTDNNGFSVDKTVNVTVSSVNDAPSITINSTLTTDEDNQQTLSFAFNDVDGDTVIATEKTGPAHGSITIEGTNIVYTPTADYNGNDSFVVTLTDNNGFSVDKTVNVTVSSVNDAPSITINSTLTTDEDNQQTLSFAFNDVDGDTVIATEKTGPAHGSITIEGTNIVYTPTADYNGNDSFVVTLTDNNGFSVDKTVNVTVSSVNDAPSITINSTLTTDEDNQQTLSFAFNDVDGDTVIATEKTGPAHGSITIEGTNIVYTPTADYNGNDSFVVTLTDNNGFSVDKTVNVTVSSVNDAPSITINSTLTTDEDNQQTLSFAFNDVDGDTVTAIEKTGPAHGSITIEGTNIVYTPTADYNGNDSFVVTLTDNNGFSVDKTVNVTVSSVNDAPSITINSTLTTDEDNQQTLSFAFNDVDGDTVIATEKTGPAHGSITIEGTNIVYTPTADYNGNDSFVVTLTDNNGFSVDKTVNVTVSSVNDAPSITINSTLTTDEDNQQTLSFAFNDVDGDTVTAIEKTGPAHGSITIEGTNIVYTPTADYNGNDSFVVTLTDNNGFSVDKTVNVTVSSVNDAPSITINSTLTTDEDNQQTLSFAFNDVDGDTVIATEKTGPAHGSITIEGTNIVYTPTADYNGNDSFVVTLTDNNGFSVDKTVNVTVSSVNDAPSITINSTLTTDEDNQQTLSFAFNDVDGDTVIATEKTGPAHGSITIEGTNIVYTPTADYNGNDSFVVTLTDNNGFSVDKTVNVTVSSVNDAPSITINSTLTTDEDNQQTLSFAFNDVDGDTVIATEKTGPAHGSITIEGTNIVYTPTADYNGNDSFVVTLTDNNGFSVDKTVNVTVSSVNDAPSITINSTLTTDEDNQQTLSFAFNDVDGDTVIATEKTGPAHGSITIEGTNIVYTPTADYNGNDSFVVTLTDNNGFSVDKTVNVTVSSVNDAPSITINSTLTTDEDNQQTLSFAFNDVDGDTVIATEKTGPAHGSITIEGTNIVYTPTADYNGNDSFVVTLTDNNGFSVDKTVNVTVSSVNDAPSITINSTLTTDEDNQQTLSFAFNDVDGDTVIATEKTGPAHGSITIEGTNIVYTPTADYNGNDSFVVTLTDNNGFSVDKTVNVTVSSVNDEPIAVDDHSYTFTQSDSGRYTLDVLANDTDSDGDALQLEWVITDSGAVSYQNGFITLVADTLGEFTLKYSVSDDNGGNDVAEVTVVIVADEGSAPIVTAPNAIDVNATALFTKVNLGVAVASDSNGSALPISLVEDNTFFAPGLHTIYWEATDSNGRQGVDSQQITVHPLISFGKDDETTEGTTHSVEVYLNGEAPSYPVTVPYVVSGSADSSDHNLIDGEINITSGTTGSIDFTIVDDMVAEGPETIIITLGDGLNKGSKSSYTLNIQESNVAPKVNLAITQDGESRSVVESNTNMVTVTATVEDANIEDTHSYTWINDDSSLANVSTDDNVFAFSPEGLLVSVYHLTLEVDDGSEVVSKDIYIEVTDQLATLTAKDSDGDLIPDDEEGYTDSDNDGIPDYLDAISECNVIQHQALESQDYLIEGEPGVCLRKGVTLVDNQTGGTQLLTSELITDSSAANIGGIFDFVAYGLPTPGQSYQIALPQRLPVPASAVYRKYSEASGWIDFQIDADNYISSSAGEEGYCPPPGSSMWSEGLTEGHWCVQLTIEDGGPNDDDGLANGTIVDPGGVATTSQNILPVAVDDNVYVAINGSLLIDVLDNDSDADGDTLSINSASVSFGTVSIENDLIVYQAADEFYGTDTIEYSVTDGNGGTAYAEVTVNVTPSAGGTVSNSAGGGSIGGLTVLILSLLGVARSHCRQLSAVLLTVCSFNSQANWFIDASLGQSIADNRETEFDEFVQDKERSALAWSVGLGYQLTADWNVTGRYLDLGEGSATLSTDNRIEPTTYHQSVTKVTPVLAEGFAIDVSYTLLKDNHAKVNAVIGGFAWNVDFDSTYQETNMTSSENGIDPYIGVSFDYKLTDDWYVGWQFTRYFIDLNDVTTMELTLQYYFDN